MNQGQCLPTALPSLWWHWPLSYSFRYSITFKPHLQVHPFMRWGRDDEMSISKRPVVRTHLEWQINYRCLSFSVNSFNCGYKSLPPGCNKQTLAWWSQEGRLLSLRAHAGFLGAVYFALQASETQARLLVWDLQLRAILGIVSISLVLTAGWAEGWPPSAAADKSLALCLLLISRFSLLRSKVP